MSIVSILKGSAIVIRGLIGDEEGVLGEARPMSQAVHSHRLDWTRSHDLETEPKKAEFEATTTGKMREVERDFLSHYADA